MSGGKLLKIALFLIGHGTLPQSMEVLPTTLSSGNFFSLIGLVWHEFTLLAGTNHKFALRAQGIFPLRLTGQCGYDYFAPHKTGAGRENPDKVKGDNRRLSRLFYCRNVSPPIFSGVEPHRINGGAGRAAFGLAGSL